jgi:hypothetical protein
MEGQKKVQSLDLTAKKLRTGEIAIWDSTTKSVILLSPVDGEKSTAFARVITGASLKALEEALGEVIQLV